jgi:uncharacterized protein DUF4407/FHA domain-containing protein
MTFNPSSSSSSFQATGQPNQHRQRRLGPITRLLLWCSGVRRDLLARTPTEVANYVGLGGAVLTTATFAAASSSAALAMALHKPVASMVPFGIGWGLAILNLDRWLVATAGGTNATAKLASFLPRLALAVVIAVVIAEPLLLTVFDREIQAKMVELRTKDATAQRQRLAAKYGPLLRDLEQQTTRLQDQVKAHEARVQALYREAIGEAEGTSGTQLLGKGPVFTEKWRKYQQEQAILTRARRAAAQEVARLQDRGRRLQRDWDKERTAGEHIINGNQGLLLRVEALSALTRDNRMVATAALVLRLVIVLVDSLAVIVKLLQSLGRRRPYERLFGAHQHRETVEGDLLEEQADADAQLARTEAQVQQQSKLEAIESRAYEDRVLRRFFYPTFSPAAPLLVGADVAAGVGARGNGYHPEAAAAAGGSNPDAEDRSFHRLQIGRAPDNDIVLDHALVSWYHAAVVRDGQPDYRVNDLGSYSGTFVNGRRIATAALHDNDILRIGNTVFRFQSGTLEQYVNTVSGHTGPVDSTRRDDREPQHRGAPQRRGLRRRARARDAVKVAAVIAAFAAIAASLIQVTGPVVLPVPTTQAPTTHAPVTLPCERSSRPCGRILSPVSRERVPRAFTVDGVLAKVPPNRHVWLAVQIGNLLWVKEPGIPVTDRRWSQEVVEAGNPPNGKFALVLLMVDPAGDQQIRRWLRGTPTGLRSIRGSTKLDVVRDLTLR